MDRLDKIICTRCNAVESIYTKNDGTLVCAKCEKDYEQKPDSNVVNPLLCDLTTNDIEIILDALHQYISICRKYDNIDLMDDTIKLFLKLKKD